MNILFLTFTNAFVTQSHRVSISIEIYNTHTHTHTYIYSCFYQSRILLYVNGASNLRTEFNSRGIASEKCNFIYIIFVETWVSSIKKKIMLGAFRWSFW